METSTNRKGCLRLVYLPVIVLIGIAVAVEIHRFEFVSSAVHVMGTVVNSWSDASSEGVLSEFSSSNGQKHSLYYDTYYGTYDQKGSAVPIIYDASNPSHAELNTPNNWLSPISEFLIIFGLALLTAAFFSDRSVAKKRKIMAKG